MKRSVSKGIEKGMSLCDDRRGLTIDELFELGGGKEHLTEDVINGIMQAFYFGISVGYKISKKEGEK